MEGAGGREKGGNRVGGERREMGEKRGEGTGVDGREGKRGGESGGGRAAEVIYGLATRDFPSARAGKSGSRVPSMSVHGQEAQCTASSLLPSSAAGARGSTHASGNALLFSPGQGVYYLSGQ